MHEELKKLRVQNFPGAAGGLLRSYIEAILLFYGEKKKIGNKISTIENMYGKKIWARCLGDLKGKFSDLNAFAHGNTYPTAREVYNRVR